MAYKFEDIYFQIAVDTMFRNNGGDPVFGIDVMKSINEKGSRSVREIAGDKKITPAVYYHLDQLSRSKLVYISSHWGEDRYSLTKIGSLFLSLSMAVPDYAEMLGAGDNYHVKTGKRSLKFKNFVSDLYRSKTKP